jgi:[protein-PII] uridylyltransferase
VFDLQAAVAESLGLQPKDGVRASELMMRRYYWAAKAVTQLNQILLLNLEERIAGGAEPPRVAVNERFLDRSRPDRGGRRRALRLRQPEAILETFLLYATVQWAQGPVQPHPARALQRPSGDGRGAGAPIRSTARSSWPFCTLPRARPTRCG